MIICRRLRQPEFRRRCRGLSPVVLRAPLREAPATAQDEPNRQGIHLAEPKRCLDEAGHLTANLRCLGPGTVDLLTPHGDG